VLARKKGEVKKPKATREAKEVKAGFPVVGIGASAGGLAAFESFFSGMPADVDPGMAFVLVQHLAPDHKSILCDIIQRYTRMQVFEVEDGMEVRPNCAYIIPPNRNMAFLNGSLQLLAPEAPRGRRLPIDFFFRSLAQDQHERAIGIVLSGTGSDGAQGIKAIKGEGGMAMAQSLDSTDYDGMPKSAIETGLVDYELPPGEMPARLIAYAAHAFGKLPKLAAAPPQSSENALKKIFVLLRASAGHDFSLYKPSTINRRIERRMAVNQIETMEGYVKHLQKTPEEADALFHDLLIGVTSFFRDPEAFKALEEHVVPKLFAGKPSGSVIRAWTPGCATGEEPYSLAILLQERLESLKQSCNVQIFATDIDSQSIATARAGLYPASIIADVSPERLARFFSAEPNCEAYRIHKGIRDMLIFSEQDVIKDPPFSKLDLISCRNLMIYMGKDLQKKLLPLFHYALNPGGFLFLGSSETIGEFGDLFDTVDRKLKLYRRKEDAHSARRIALGRVLPSMTAADLSLQHSIAKVAEAGKTPLREIAEQALLQQVAPSAALVNCHGDILYLHGRSGLYLELPPGEAGVNNIVKMAREGLRRDLAAALRKAASRNEIVCQTGLRVKSNDGFAIVNLIVRPMATAPSPKSPEERLFLVVLEEAANVGLKQEPKDPSAEALKKKERPACDAGVAALRQELRTLEEYSQTTLNELETSNEELKSANEEMQSVNEELQSTNEEMETAKEELQSVNEELTTVNTELQTKVADLSRANNDMNNLLAGTGIATVFVDHQLRIMRFTPASTQIINLIPGDTGRPVGHIVSNLVGYSSIVEDAQAVLDTLIPKEMEVRTASGAWFAMRIQPYRTLDNMIEGAVITFINITDRKLADEALRKANAMNRLSTLVRDSMDAIVAHDLEGRILAWNPAAERIYGWTEAEALKMNVCDLVPEELRSEAVAKAKSLGRSKNMKPCRMRRLAKNGSILELWMTFAPLANEAGKVYGITTTGRRGSSQD